MRIQTLALVLCGCVATSTVIAQPAPATQPVTGATLQRLLPTGTVRAQVMELGAPPRMTELSSRLQAAARRDPAWWTAHVQAARPGEPLAWDARLGLTEPEYREFLSLTDSMRIRPVAPVDLHVSAAPGGWRVEGGTSLPELEGIVIDTVAWEVQTPLGKATMVKAITANDNQRATGPWDGVQWQRADSSIVQTGSGTAITFALGRLRDSGRVLLYYDGKQATDGTLSARASRILTFDPPR